MNKKINMIITGMFILLIFGFGIAFWVVPDKAFSPEENRTLQTFPDLTPGGWLDGSVSADLIDYYADQFPARTSWVGLHGLSELATLRGESSGVLYAPNGQLAVRRFDVFVSLTERAETDHYIPAHVQNGLDALVALDVTLDAAGIPLTVLIPPRTVDVAAADFAYPAVLSDRLDAAIRDTLSGSVDHVDLLAELRARHEAGEYVYYRTDHHWTTAGAYLAYTRVMGSFGMAADTLPADAFTVRTVEGFYGTTYSRAGLYFVEPDVLEIWEAADGSDARFCVRDERGNTVIENGFISEKYLSEKDKYSAFLDGTHRLLTITDTAAEGDRPRLLLARDSFANSMVPFLARHFDIVMVNLSGGMTNLSELAKANDCDRVLVVCNRENLIASDCFVRIE